MYVQAMSDPSARSAVAVGVKGAVTTRELDRQERSIARRSAETRAVVPSVEYQVEVNARSCRARVDELGCSLTALVIAAACRCLRGLPRLNGAYRDGRYELYEAINVGVTLSAGETAVTATVLDADRLPATEIDAELIDLGSRASRGELTPAELSGATFTVIPEPADGVSILSPLITPPQAAALAVGGVREATIVDDGQVTAGWTMSLTLACDHRIVPASEAGRFLSRVKTLLEEEAP